MMAEVLQRAEREEVLQRAERLLRACYEARQEVEAVVRFTEFWEHIGGWVQGHAWLCLGRWGQSGRDDRAEDVAQCVFIRVWQTWRNPGSRWRADKGALRRWLSRLVSNTITDLHRGDRKFGALLLSQLDPTRDVGPEAVVIDQQPTPEEDVTLADQLDAFLRSLPESDRRMLEMKMYEDLTQGEIAERLGISDALVSRRLKEMCEQLAGRLGLGSR